MDSIKPDEDFAVLLRTTDVALLMIIKSLLDSAGIQYMVQGAEDFRMLPLGSPGGFFGPAALGATILVRREDLADARQLLDQCATHPYEDSHPDPDRNDE
jgi:hypothetical protein